MPARTSTRGTAQDTPQTAGTDWEAQPKCGHSVNTQKGVKPCVKPLGHTEEGSAALKEFGKGHVSRIQRRVERKPVALKTIMTFSEVPADEIVEYGSGRNAAERDETQQAVDANVSALHAKWIAAGSPKLGFNEMIRNGLAGRYAVSPEDEDAVRAMLKSAGRFTQRGGQASPIVSVRVAPLKTFDNGDSFLYWIAVDVNPHEKKENGE